MLHRGGRGVLRYLKSKEGGERGWASQDSILTGGQYDQTSKEKSASYIRGGGPQCSRNGSKKVKQRNFQRRGVFSDG